MMIVLELVDILLMENPILVLKKFMIFLKKIFSQINKDCYSDDNYVDYDNYDFDFSNILPNSDSDTDSDSDDF